MKGFGCLSLLATLCFVPAVSGQTAALGKVTPDGAISFEVVEEFLVNQSHKIRLMPEGTETLDPQTLKKLPRIELSQAGVIRNDGAGHLFRLNGKGAPREFVLPENVQVKAAVPVQSVIGGLLLEVSRAKKSKQRDKVAPESVFVYIAAMEPDRAVFDLVSQEWVFRDLDEHLAAMKGFVQSFPKSPLLAAFRAGLEQRLSRGLADFENRGAFDDLLVISRFAGLASSAFPGDGPLETLQQKIKTRISMVENSIETLRSLAVSGYWDAFLARYLAFEPYQWSFPGIVALRERALEESARIHAQRGRAFQLRGDHDSAIEQIRAALSRHPGNADLTKLLDSEHLLASQIEARRNAASRKRLPADSPQDVRFKRALYNAKRAVQDREFAKAQDAIKDAERENAEAAEILLARAQLLAAQNQLGAALPLLDRYDRLASEPVERQEGQTVRNQVLYELVKKKDVAGKQIDAAIAEGDYVRARELLRTALDLDAEDPAYLYPAGAMAAVLRDNAGAKPILTKYLATSNSLAVDLKMRDAARRLLSVLDEPARPEGAGSPNWFSGRKLAEGLYYCPQTMAFQLPIDSVAGYKTRVNFAWKAGKLDNIRTTFEDEKGSRNFRAMNPANKAADAEVGQFYFDYSTSGRVRTVRTKRVAGKDGGKFKVVRSKEGVLLVDDAAQPLVVLPADPQVNPKALDLIDGPAFTIVSGNSFFNPFIWDDIHYFSARYDSSGRLESAQEWGADNLVRFTWEGDRLTEIRAWRKDSDTPYYRRTLNYAGSNMVSEDYSGTGKTGHIKYVYTGKALKEIKLEDTGAHDGKNWTVRFGS